MFFSGAKKRPRQYSLRTYENLDNYLSSRPDQLAKMTVIIDDIIDVNKTAQIAEMLEPFLSLMDFHNVQVILISNFRIRNSAALFEADLSQFAEFAFEKVPDNSIFSSISANLPEATAKKLAFAYEYYNSFYSSIDQKKALVEDDLRFYTRAQPKNAGEFHDKERVKTKIKKGLLFSVDLKRYYKQSIGFYITRQL